jgi:hypothetical protein
MLLLRPSSAAKCKQTFNTLVHASRILLHNVLGLPVSVVLVYRPVRVKTLFWQSSLTDGQQAVPGSRESKRADSLKAVAIYRHAGIVRWNGYHMDQKQPPPRRLSADM